MLSQLAKQLTEGWNSYYAGKRTDSQNPIHNLILKKIPAVLESWHGNNSQYMIKGSDGQGNLNRTPWIATFNVDVTTSAERGYYLVYLFRDTLTEMVLELGFGATQFQQKYGKGPKFFDEVEKAVERMRITSAPLLAQLDNSVRKRISASSTKLDSSGDFKLRAYEQCAIFSVTYSISSLPSEQSLRDDYLQMLRLYDSMVESPTLPSEDAYVVENSATPPVPMEIDIQPFVPKQKKVTKHSASNSVGRQQKRFSKTSDKVGRIGEEFVFNVEKEELRRAGREDLAIKVIWHRIHAENRTPGWDITSYDAQGNIRYIEVKASMGKEISDVELTRKEWQQASLPANSEKYYIYFVVNALTKPKIRTLKNPASWVQKKLLELSIERYTLHVSVSTSTGPA